MFQVVSFLILVTVVTKQVYYGSSQETTLTMMPANSEPSYSKVTLENVTNKYNDLMPRCFDGFDKEMEHKQNFGLITVTSKLYLTNCQLCGLYNMHVKGSYFLDRVFDLVITRGTVYLPDFNILCILEIQQMAYNWNSWIRAEANEILANLTIVQDDDLSMVSINFKHRNEPKLTFSSSNAEAWEPITKFFLHDLNTYLTHVMSENLKTTVPSYLNKVAKEFIVETPLNSSGAVKPYLEHTTIAPSETTIHPIALNHCCLKFTIEDVISKYHSIAPQISGFDSTLVHTQNFALINVTSELILENCNLFGLQTMKADDIYHEKQVLDFEITETTVNISRLTINCNLKIRQMSSSFSVDFQAYSGTIPGDLTIIQNRDLDLLWIKFKVLREPRIRLTINNLEVLSFVKRYFMHDLTEYLTKVISDNLRTTVPLYFRKVAKLLCKFDK